MGNDNDLDPLKLKPHDGISNYERAVKLLGDVDVADPVDVSLWRETAAALGKPAPSPKRSASNSAGAQLMTTISSLAPNRGIRWVAELIGRNGGPNWLPVTTASLPNVGYPTSGTCRIYRVVTSRH